jgi:hypothetical protein
VAEKRTPRAEILHQANEQRKRTNVVLLNAAQRTGKHLNLLPPIRSMPEAVCIVRRRRLVQPEVLAAAGFGASS